MTKFRRLIISRWQQFRSVEIEFAENLTVLTGANGSGKTTLLNILAKHHNWDVPSLATPTFSSLSNLIQYVIRLFVKEEQTQETIIGRIEYTDGGISELKVPKANQPSYQVNVHNKHEVPCFFIPSHRSVYRYQALSQIPGARLAKSQAFDRVRESTRTRYFGGNETPASYFMKETLIAWSIFGRGNQDMPADPELLANYEGFQEILRKLLPANLGFRRFSIRNLEIVLECASGDFMIDGASGGLSTIIDLAWQIFMFTTKERPSFTVVVDEIENHLHPTMQRRILSDLLEAFPHVTFIVSTHSPLIVNSVRNAAVYVLSYNSQNEVESQWLDFQNTAKTASEILDQVLGVSSPMPVWAEDLVKSIVDEFSKPELKKEDFAGIRARLSEIGLAHYLPETLTNIIGHRSQ